MSWMGKSERNSGEEMVLVRATDHVTRMRLGRAMKVRMRIPRIFRNTHSFISYLG